VLLYEIVTKRHVQISDLQLSTLRLAFAPESSMSIQILWTSGFLKGRVQYEECQKQLCATDVGRLNNHYNTSVGLFYSIAHLRLRSNV
jgi:hypothetical protein